MVQMNELLKVEPHFKDPCGVRPYTSLLRVSTTAFLHNMLQFLCMIDEENAVKKGKICEICKRRMIAGGICFGLLPFV